MIETGRHALAVMERLEAARTLDEKARALDSLACPVVGEGRRAAILSGRFLGHTFHALLTDFVEGPWMAATFLDLFGPAGSEASARRLLALALMVVPLAHLSGCADWRQSNDQASRRVGVVHGMAVSAATVLYGASYLARCRSRQRTAALLGVAGGIIALVDGYLGGHLSHVRGVAGGEQV